MRLIFFVLAGHILLLSACSPAKPEALSPWLNHSDSAYYVGIETCRGCHPDKYETFLHTGMGSSFGSGNKLKSAADFSGHPVLYDSVLDFYYHPFWQNDQLRFREFRMQGKDTVFSREVSADYIIGSGQHTNSHLYSKNGYVFQIPMTFYSQKGTWDFPPGFERGNNSRFSRKIGLECMSCHNAMPSFVKGSENKFSHIPMGIDCERCHGPGSIHVNQKKAGILVDTSAFIDYSIVNPRKLSADMQFDVCQRCHLQGNAVLKEGKSFFDFRPGMRLSEILSVFLPVYEGGEEDFIMASHAERLRQSKCFLQSNKPEQTGKGFASSSENLTCITCHNPHVSVKVTGREIFNAACKNCHGRPEQKLCSEKKEIRLTKSDDCTSCHMPRSGSIDIPHVSVTDHFIRKPVSENKVNSIRKFIRLASLNDPSPGPDIRAKAFLQQYERFEKKPWYLDSVALLLPEPKADDPSWVLHARIHLFYLQNDFKGMGRYAALCGPDKLIENYLGDASWDNRNAWTAYRLGEGYYSTGKFHEAVKFFSHARKLAPYVPEFGNKLAGALILIQNPLDAKKVLEEILKEDDSYVPALNNMGYLSLSQGFAADALRYYQKALSLDPDYEPLLMNLAGYHLSQNHKSEAQRFLEKVLANNPANEKARQMIRALHTY